MTERAQLRLAAPPSADAKQRLEHMRRALPACRLTTPLHDVAARCMGGRRAWHMAARQNAAALERGPRALSPSARRRSRKDRGEAVDDDAVAAKAAALDAALTAHPLPGQALGARAGGAADGRRYADAADAPSTVFDLTGRTGSYLYMSPEVTRCEPYNDRADVRPYAFSLYYLCMCM